MLTRSLAFSFVAITLSCSDVDKPKGHCEVLVYGDSQVFNMPYKEGWCIWGIPGATSEYLLTYAKTGFLSEVTFDLLVIQMGSNDLTKARKDGAEPDLERIAQNIVDFHQFGRLFITNVFPASSNAEYSEDFRQKADVINSLTDAQYVPVYDYLDDIHVGPETYINWMQIIENVQ